MLCHDYATIICCDHCSFELEIEGNYQRRTMNRLAKERGWKIGKQDICPFCIERAEAAQKEGME